MNRSTKGALAAAAAGVVLLGGAGTIAFSTPGVTNVTQGQWALLIVAMGLVGYTAAIFVAVFGKRGPRRVRS